MDAYIVRDAIHVQYYMYNITCTILYVYVGNICSASQMGIGEAMFHGGTYRICIISCFVFINL